MRLALDPRATEPVPEVERTLDHDLDSTNHVIDFLSAE